MKTMTDLEDYKLEVDLNSGAARRIQSFNQRDKKHHRRVCSSLSYTPCDATTF